VQTAGRAEIACDAEKEDPERKLGQSLFVSGPISILMTMIALSLYLTRRCDLKVSRPGLGDSRTVSLGL
jgi:hypothetical protein